MSMRKPIPIEAENSTQPIFVDNMPFDSENLEARFSSRKFPLGQLVFELNSIRRYNPIFDQKYANFVNTM